MKPYIIQHAQFLKSEWKGIDGILSFAYMGSAQYDFGARPKSLERIRDEKSLYGFSSHVIGKKLITVYGKKIDTNRNRGFVTEIAKSDYQCKERSLFNDYINDTMRDFGNPDFWWDLENDFMFWRTDVSFEESFRKVI